MRVILQFSLIHVSKDECLFAVVGYRQGKFVLHKVWRGVPALAERLYGNNLFSCLMGCIVVWNNRRTQETATAWSLSVLKLLNLYTNDCSIYPSKHSDYYTYQLPLH